MKEYILFYPTLSIELKKTMTSKRIELEKQKLIQEKCQQILTQLLRDEDNKYCVDCDAKGNLVF